MPTGDPKLFDSLSGVVADSVKVPDDLRTNTIGWSSLEPVIQNNKLLQDMLAATQKELEEAKLQVQSLMESLKNVTETNKLLVEQLTKLLGEQHADPGI